MQIIIIQIDLIVKDKTIIITKIIFYINLSQFNQIIANNKRFKYHIPKIFDNHFLAFCDFTQSWQTMLQLILRIDLDFYTILRG